jgi:UDP-N-acetylmuramoyl-L-alanyl-D-glutamate--2,6-diaminopimelate ligase
VGAPAIANSEMDPTTLAALTGIARRRRLALRTVGEAGTALRLLAVLPRPDGQVLRIEAAGVTRDFALPLPGRFQADNALMAAALAMALGQRDAVDCLGSLHGVRGRLELAARLPNGAAVYVDYAHTPDALERLLTALRPHTAGRLHVVFGAGGDRDRTKRPLMGAAAAAADVVVVTSDNPRSEDPAAIAEAAAEGVRSAGVDPVVELDRRVAIGRAVELARDGDVVLVAGKGHEQGQTAAGVTVAFDDRVVAREELGARGWA